MTFSQEKVDYNWRLCLKIRIQGEFEESFFNETLTFLIQMEDKIKG